MTAPRHPYHPRHALYELTLARVLEFVRDPAALFWTFGFPVLLAVALGIAFRDAPPPELTVVVDAAHPKAETFATALDDSEGLTAEVLPTDAAREAVARGRAELMIGAPQDEPTASRYYFDPAKPDARTARLLVDDALQRMAGRADVLAARDEPVTEEGGRYIDFLIPGLIGLNVLGSAMWGIGFAVVEARKRKLLKRLAATPMSRAQFLLSYMLSRLLFLSAEVAVLIGFGWLAFDVEVRGSWLALVVLSLGGTLALTGVAMLIAARPTSTEVASGWANLFSMPMWILSGAFFSYERFPDAMLPFIKALPLTALNDGLRAIMNEGQGLAAVLPQLAVLGAWGGIAFVIALRIFRWQ